MSEPSSSPRSSPPRVAFLGSKEAGLRVLKALTDVLPVMVAWHPNDLADGRSVWPRFLEFSVERTVLVERVGRGMATSLAEAIAAHRPTHVFVCGWYQHIPVEQFPDVTFVAIHYSKLPAYRGNAPVVWQLIEGEPRIGWSVFRMTNGLDEGPVYVQDDISIEPNEAVGTVLTRLTDVVCTCVREHAPAIVAGDLTARAQFGTVITYGAVRIPEDGRIDWRQSTTTVHNFIRAQSHPYPGAWTRLVFDSAIDSHPVVRIWRAEPAKLDVRTFAAPGSVLRRLEDGSVLISCGSLGPSVMALRVLAAQLAGQNQQTPRDIFDSVRIRCR